MPKVLLFISSLSFLLAIMPHVHLFASGKLILNGTTLFWFVILIKRSSLQLLERSFCLNLLPFNLFINTDFFSVLVRLLMVFQCMFSAAQRSRQTMG